MSIIPTIAIALGGAFLFERLQVPAGALLGALSSVAILNMATSSSVAPVPEGARFVAYAALGWLIGEGVTQDTVKTLARSLVPVLLVVLALLAFGVALGWLLVRFGIMDPATAYLATSPGALSQMAAMGVAIGADASTVVAVHTLRVVTLIVVAPAVGRLAGLP